jgi:hypothetical protein
MSAAPGAVRAVRGLMGATMSFERTTSGWKDAVNELIICGIERVPECDALQDKSVLQVSSVIR